MRYSLGLYRVYLSLPAASLGLGTAVGHLNGAEQPFADTRTVSV